MPGARALVGQTAQPRQIGLFLLNGIAIKSRTALEMTLCVTQYARKAAQ